jgi:hypothetical protein
MPGENGEPVHQESRLLVRKRGHSIIYSLSKQCTMPTPTKESAENNNANTDPTTQESIEQGKKMSKVQQDQNPAPEEQEKKADAEKDAEKWRNEG